MISAVTLVCTIFSQKRTSIHSAAKLMDQFGIFSPAMHVVEYKHTKFQLQNPINSSEFVGNTDDVENAWKKIAYLPDQLVRDEDFPKLQKPSDSLRVTDPKTGEMGYRAGLEVFHQLRCLNLVRMATYPEYFPKLSSDIKDGSGDVRIHLDDCIESLRMSLMCLSDVNVFTFHDKSGFKNPIPDYESHHVCRNFDDIKQWALNNAMPALDV
ncbi:hypothetical protein EJ04DRAFT_442867 [Polyplosphaeria fusca]|uniref:Uncharacterized protein n=1 Tax=Polyplosphaeria fusca TaxID=682080 RepID=A0A9P4UYM0_9PLEO|nr:hypothetical protein EJ04DRAFT_442867 [Polyplosphaeria fusca]